MEELWQDHSQTLTLQWTSFGIDKSWIGRGQSLGGRIICVCQKDAPGVNIATCCPGKKLVLVSCILDTISSRFICETRASHEMLDRKTKFARVQSVFDLVYYIKSYDVVNVDQKCEILRH